MGKSATSLAFIAVFVAMIASASLVRADDGSYNTYDTGAYNTYDTGSYNTYDTGSYNTYDTGSSNTYDTGAYNTYDTGSYNTYDTGAYNTYDTGAYNTYDTGAYNTYDTGAYNTYDTGAYNTYDTGSHTVSGGIGSSGTTNYGTQTYSNGGMNTVSGGGLSSAPVTYNYGSLGSATHSVVGGGLSSAPVTFSYGPLTSGTHSVVGGGLSSAPVTFTYAPLQSGQQTVSGGGLSSAPAVFSYAPITSGNTVVTGGIGGGGNYNYSGYSAPTCWLSSSPQYIRPGASAVLSWTNNNASSMYISGVGTVGQGGGTSVVAPSQTTQYTATATGPGGSTNCYATVVVQGSPVVAAASVSLSQVPYTGLDLGPVGTALYWLGLVLACALMAYLIAVKRVQNSFFAWLRVQMMGDPDEVTHPAYLTNSQSEQSETVSAAPALAQRSSATTPRFSSDYTDPFIAGQIAKAQA